MECVYHFHITAGFRTHETAGKKSYYKINHYMHLITWNGPPFITLIYMPYPTIPSTKVYGNRFNIIASPIGKYIYASFHVNGKKYNFKICSKHIVHKLPNQEGEICVLYFSLDYLNQFIPARFKEILISAP